MIRLAGPGDAAQVAAIYAPHVTGASTSFEVTPPDPAEMAARIASTLAHTPYLVLETGGEVLGFAYASKHRERAAYQWSVDVSVYVRPDAHRQGCGPRPLRVAVRAPAPAGVLRRACGHYASEPGQRGAARSARVPARRVYPSVGFKRGGWHDVGWWQLPLRERTGTPIRRALSRKRSGIRGGTGVSGGREIPRTNNERKVRSTRLADMALWPGRRSVSVGQQRLSGSGRHASAARSACSRD
jgi:phosphinothricin acetyltransferase